MASDDLRNLSVLRRQRDATRYRILVEIAERQPAVSQREIAETIGVTAQAVSEYVGGLVDDGYVAKRGRGRYEITKEGVDWLISRTDELRALTEYVSEEIVDEVAVDAAVAGETIQEGETVTLSMRDGVQHAVSGAEGATAVAVTDADPGEPVGVAEFDGLIEFEPGTVTILSIPPIGTGSVAPEEVDDRIGTQPVLAVAGTEALALTRTAGHEPDIRFGTPSAVREAATRGLDVFLVAVEGHVSSHTEALADADLSYQVVDLVHRGGR